VKRSRAALEEALAAYRERVLQAFREVHDAMVKEQRSSEAVGALASQCESAAKGLSEAERRYRSGGAGYLAVITAMKSLYQSEQELISAKSAALQARIALYRALGGGWSRQAAESALRRDLIKETNAMREGSDD
jgi:multidrug efflux system outer membrane protein